MIITDLIIRQLLIPIRVNLQMLKQALQRKKRSAQIERYAFLTAYSFKK